MELSFYRHESDPRFPPQAHPNICTLPAFATVQCKMVMRMDLCNQTEYVHYAMVQGFIQYDALRPSNDTGCFLLCHFKKTRKCCLSPQPILQAQSEEDACVVVEVEQGQNKGFNFKTHPNIDKQLYSQKSLLGLKAPDRPFPVGSSVGVLKWHLKVPYPPDVHIFC